MESNSPQPKRSSWLRILGYIVVVLVLLLVVAYFVLTSSAFFKGVILPKASQSVGAQITVEDATISPFSHIYLHQLKVQTTGATPLLQAEDVRLRYNLMSIIGGTIKVDEVSLVKPVINVVVNADGTSNLDPLTQGKTNAPEKKQSKPSKPLQLDIRNVAVTDAIFHYMQTAKDGSQQVADLTGFNVSLDQLQNGQSGHFRSAAMLKMHQSTNGSLQEQTGMEAAFTLGTDLTPSMLTAKVQLSVTDAQGLWQSLNGFRAVFTSDVTPTEIKEFAERFYRNDQLLGQITINGPFNMANKEGHLKLKMDSIDRQTLQLIGAPMGLDFDSSQLGATADLDFTRSGSVIGAIVNFSATNFSVTQNSNTTPTLNLSLACNVSVNTLDKSATIQSFTLDGKEGDKSFIMGSLSQPMMIGSTNNSAASGDAAFTLIVTNFDFAQWQPFVGQSVTAGNLGLKMDVTSHQAGQQLAVAVTSHIDGLAAKIGTNALSDAMLDFKLQTQVNEMKKIKDSTYSLDLTEQAQPVLNVTGSASYDGTNASVHTQLQAVPQRLLGHGPATALSLGIKLDAATAKQVTDLHQLQLLLPATDRAPSNEVDITGQVDLSNPNLTKGNLTIQANTVDVTPLYDAFAGQPAATNQAQAAPAPIASTSADNSSNAEPPAVTLPLQFTASVNINQLWLREISAQNCQVTTKIDGNKIAVDPCQLNLNGGPIKSTVNLDLGVPGYNYAVNLTMDKVPLEPLANTFSPENAGHYKGFILANSQIKGAGITGVNLHKNLSGQVGFTFTNASIQLTGDKLKKIIGPVSSLLGLNELTSDPLQWVDAKLDMSAGNINITRCMVESPAFEGSVQGTIPIADVVSNSPLNLPLHISVARSLAQRSGLASASPSADGAYVALPDFAVVKGTIGQPKSDVNRMALGNLLLNSGANMAQKYGIKVPTNTSSALSGFKGFLNSGKTSNTNGASTNATKSSSPFDLFKRN